VVPPQGAPAGLTERMVWQPATFKGGRCAINGSVNGISSIAINIG
jgi:hypothetical protein